MRWFHMPSKDSLFEFVRTEVIRRVPYRQRRMQATAVMKTAIRRPARKIRECIHLRYFGHRRLRISPLPCRLFPTKCPRFHPPALVKISGSSDKPTQEGITFKFFQAIAVIINCAWLVWHTSCALLIAQEVEMKSVGSNPSKLGQLLVISIGILTAASGLLAAEKLPLERIQLPAGFQISLFAEVPNARSLTLSPNGTLFVGSQKAGRVYSIQSRGGEREVRKPIVVAERINMPNGVAFKDGALYVAEVNRVLRFDGIESRLLEPPKPVVVNDSFPTDRQHGRKFIAFGPDGQLYVPV